MGAGGWNERRERLEAWGSGVGKGKRGRANEWRKCPGVDMELTWTKHGRQLFEGSAKVRLYERNRQEGIRVYAVKCSCDGRFRHKKRAF